MKYGGGVDRYVKNASKWRTDIDKEEAPTAATRETAGLRRGTEGDTVGMAAAGPEKGKGSAPEEEGGGRYLTNQQILTFAWCLIFSYDRVISDVFM